MRDLTLEVRLLGAVSVELDGVALELGGVRQRSLLALLVLNRNRAVTGEALADSLWPDELPPTATKTIQVYVSRLRRLLRAEGNRLESIGAGYRFRLGDDELDAATFEVGIARAREEARAGNLAATRSLLEAGLGLWRGEPLSDIAAQPFARREADRLDELRWLAREELYETRLRAGDAKGVLGDLRTAVREQPQRERLVGQLMRALYAEGRQTEALAAYHEARHYLSDELGIDPGPALQGLEAAILRQELAVSAGPQLSESPKHGNEARRADESETYDTPPHRIEGSATSRLALPLTTGALAVGILVLLAIAYAPGREAPGSAGVASNLPSAQALSSPSAWPSPSPMLLVVAPDLGDETWVPTKVDPGRYTWQNFRPVTSLTIPSPNWYAPGDSVDGAELGYFGSGTLGADPPFGEIFLIRAQLVLDKPCVADEVTRLLGDRPLDFIEWVAAHPFLATEGVQPRNVAGYPGLMLDVSVVREKTAEDCPADSGNPALMRRIALLPAEGPGFLLFAGDRGRFIAFDVGEGPPVLVLFRAPADDFEGFVPIAEQVVGSITVSP
jgi:DNA-binding SARP family transcriptional activator